MTDLTERVTYAAERVLVPGAEHKLFTPADWAQLELPMPDRLTGWTDLQVGAGDHPTMEVWLCPKMLAVTSSHLPWSEEPDSWVEILDLDALNDPDDDVYVIEGGDDLLDARAVYGDGDSPSPDGYWYFDNYIRFITRILQYEATSLHQHMRLVAGQWVQHTMTAEERHDAAWMDLYGLHPACHRLVMAIQAAAIDLASEARS